MTEDAAKHFRSMSWLIEALAEHGIALLAHRYDMQAFGCFELILGSGHDRLRFVWDGKESILSLFTSRIGSSSDVPRWVHDADFSLPNSTGLFEEIASQAVDFIEPRSR
jgi:hypothetical protein